MRLLVVVVGRVRGPLLAAVEEYENRIPHYYPFEVVEVREEPARRGTPPERVMKEEGTRLLERVPAGYEIIALDREGKGWSSEILSGHLAEQGVRGSPGTAFLIGGALGLSASVLDRASRRLSLSDFTLPHELARLVLAEQLYRAGTIARGEPYHRGRGGRG
jgi:23S rRNA (pseudouridine1915-N3)-methyltransferase